MRAPTHAAFGLLCTASLFALGGRALHQDLPALGCALLSSLLPDLDSPHSALGRLLPFVSERIERRWGHRGATHSLLALGGLGLLLLPLACLRLPWYAALMAGYLSHLVADCYTKSGAPLFHPYPRLCVFPGGERFRIHTGSAQEGVLLVVLLFLLALLFPVSRAGGVWRALRYLAATPPMAYRDYREATTQTRLQFKGYWRDTHQPAQGEALVLDGRIDRFLLAWEGQILTYGEYGDILPEQARIRITQQQVQVDTLRVQDERYDQILQQIPAGAFVSGRLESALPLDPNLRIELLRLLADRHPSVRFSEQALELEYAPRSLLTQLKPRRSVDPDHLEQLQTRAQDQALHLEAIQLRRPPVHYLELREAQSRLQAARRELEQLQEGQLSFAGVLYLRRGEAP